MKQRTLLLLLFLFSLTTIHAQISHGGKPLPFIQSKSYSTDYSNLYKEMPSFDLEEELRLDALNYSDLRGGYKFAYKFMTNFTRSNSGMSFVLADGTRVWRLGLYSKDALSINLLFSEYELPEGAKVFLYNPDQTQVLGAFTSANNSTLGILPVSPVHGERLIIEYQEPANASFPGKLTIGEVNHGYRSLKGYEPRGDRSEFYCMPSTSCYMDDDEIGKMARSTVLITIDGITACTGAMVNNALNDGTPYLLTASHCLNKNFAVKNPDYEDVAGRVICFFNYKSPTCDTIMRGTEEMSVASTIYRAVNENYDMALLELMEAPPAHYQPYYAGWDIEDTGEKAPYTGIHHPYASVKRVGITEDNVKLETFIISNYTFEKNVHWKVDEWNVGSTASGSSGSPLFNADNRIIGMLSGGRSRCGAAYEDFYSALSKTWMPSESEEDNQLRHWLNPTTKEVLKVDGLDPYAATPCLRLSNIYDLQLHDSTEVTKLPPPAEGNMFGINSLLTTEYAEEYQISGTAELFGAYFVASSTMNDVSKTVEAEVNVYTGYDKPETLLHTEIFRPTYTEVSLIDSSIIETPKNLRRDQESFIYFEEPISVSGKFFISYKFTSEKDTTFAVFNLQKGETTKNTAWINQEDGWMKASSHPLTPFSTSLFIDPVIHYTNGDANEDIGSVGNVKVYLGPGNKTIYVILPEGIRNATYTLYNVNGALIQKATLTDNQTILSVPELTPGIYIAQVNGKNIFYTQKLIF